MKLLTLIIIDNNTNYEESDELEILYSSIDNILLSALQAQGKYVSFLVGNDKLSNDYLKLVTEKIKKTNFDICFINYDIIFEKNTNNKRRDNDSLLDKNIIKPYDYIWNYVYKKEILVKLLKCKSEIDFSVVTKDINSSFIKEKVYEHVNGNDKYMNSLLMFYKDNEYYKNIIYVGSYCNGIFNGYISWLKNIGKCFSNNYDIAILYDDIPDVILTELKKYFTCVKYTNNNNYTCEKLICTYSTYYYPNNIYCYQESFLFIHGNMSDYPHAMHYKDDLYSRYIAVSKESRDKAIGYYPTSKIEYIYNPYKSEKVEGSLKLISAQRSTGIKKIDRIEYMAKLLDELEIPYTWNLFTDTKENTNCNGLIFRKRVANVLPYVKDSDYLVLLSDSEALSYSVLEALCLNKKVIVTPLNAFKELNVEDGNNGYMIPFDYFEEQNKELFKEKLKEIYLNKDKKTKYIYGKERYHGYNTVFYK